jgi:hypothetical protein
MNLGVCRLCRNEKELKKSHVIPRAVFKKALKGFTYACVLDKEYNKIVKMQDQWATHLLCADCEEHLNISFEQYALNALRNTQKGVKHQEKSDYLQIVNIDQGRIILYVISILWRAIESNHYIFGNIRDLSIGERIKDFLRQCIELRSVPNINLYSVRISKLVTIIPEFKDMELNFITNITCKAEKENQRVRFLFINEGYSFEVFFHTNPGDNLSTIGVLKKNKRILKLPRIDAFSIPELNHSISSMIEVGNN